MLLALAAKPAPQRDANAASPVQFIRLETEVFAEGLDMPTGVASAGDSRLFVVEKAGRIRLVTADGQINQTPFLDITDRVEATGLEQGLLGLAFHPDFGSNGFLYVNYTGLNGDTVISRFTALERATDDADPASEQQLLVISQPDTIHNGGGLAFGPDGFLYIGMGDGGPLDDPDNNAQNGQLLLGAILRLDVDQGLPYAIPADNPFVGDPAVRDEIWAKGLRNPWRFSFDSLTGDLFIGDVGHHRWEEINYQPAGDPGGHNYGWRCYEGPQVYNNEGCGPAALYTFPIHYFAHPHGQAIIGGYVYRGWQYPFLYGLYLFADLGTRALFGLENTGGGWRVGALGLGPASWTSFGQAADGEIYLVGLGSNRLYHLTASLIELDQSVYLPFQRASQP